jgi:hypothetical protein
MGTGTGSFARGFGENDFPTWESVLLEMGAHESVGGGHCSEWFGVCDPSG